MSRFEFHPVTREPYDQEPSEAWAVQAAGNDDDTDADDDIVPGPLDEEDEGVDGDEDAPASDSIPSEGNAPDVDEGDPNGAAPAPMKDPLIVDI